MMRLLLACMLAACSADVGTAVYIAPSAHGELERIEMAVDALNGELGCEVITMHVVHDSSRRDGAVILRATDSITAHGRAVHGETQWTHHGVIVRIVRGAHHLLVAHELGHAAGLKHVSDPANLMAPHVTSLALTDEQARSIGGCR